MVNMNNKRLFKLRFSFIENVCSILHSELEIIYVLDKNVVLDICSEKIHLEKGDIYVINPGIPHAFYSGNNGLICRISIPWSNFNSDTVYLPLFQCTIRRSNNSQDAEFRFLLDQLLYFYLKDERQNQKLNRICESIISALSRDYMLTTPDFYFSQNNPYQDTRMREMLFYIHSNYDKPLSLTDLSEHLHLSAAYLSRYFKKALGFNFKDYLTKIRLWHVADDLENTTDSILHLAYANGFTNLNIFGKSFRELYKMSPTDYRTVINSKYAAQLKEHQHFFDTLLSEIENKYTKTDINSDIHALSRKIDTVKTTLMTYPWKKALNVGALMDILNTVIQKQILQLRQELDFTYIRIWGIYPEILNIQNHQIQYNFSRIDNAVRFLIENNLKPHFQLGPKPRNIKVFSETPELPEISTVTPENFDGSSYEQILDTLMYHLISSFGPAEVESWIFEMWCPEPSNIPWAAWYTDEKYKIFYNTVKKYVPNALVGGCEFIRPLHEKNIEQSATYWRKNKIVPDFISFQLYPEYDFSRVNQTDSGMLPVKSGFREEVERIRKLMENICLRDLPLFISHWNITISHTDILNDTCFKGAWMMENIIDIFQNTDMLAFSALSDMFGQTKGILPMLSGGAGLITKDGIYKPSLYALKFLNKSSLYLITIQKHFILTKDRFGSFTLLFHNVCSDTDAVESFSDSSNRKLSLTIHLILENVEAGKYYLRKTAVSPQKGSVLHEYRQWGMPTQLYSEDYKYLQKVCIPFVTISSSEAAGHSLKLTIQAMPNEFGMVEILHQY